MDSVVSVLSVVRKWTTENTEITEKGDGLCAQWTQCSQW
jgi:hypothetical protein